VTVIGASKRTIRAMSARSSSTLPWGALPPIDRRPLAHDVRCELGVAKVAELPELFRRPRVLEEDLVIAIIQTKGLAIGQSRSGFVVISTGGYADLVIGDSVDEAVLIRDAS